MPVVQPVRSAFCRTFTVRGRSGSRSSGRSLRGHAAARTLRALAAARPAGARGSDRGGRGASGCRPTPAPGRRAPACASTACARVRSRRARRAGTRRPARPARCLVRDDARRLRRVAAREQLVLQLPGARGRQEQRHRRAVPRRTPAPPRRAASASCRPQAREDHRLGDLGDGQLALHDRRGDRGEAPTRRERSRSRGRARGSGRAAPAWRPTAPGRRSGSARRVRPSAAARS